MRKFWEVNGYQQVIEFYVKSLPVEATWYSCTCPDFTYRRIKKVGEGSNTKYELLGPCKHLVKIKDKLKEEYGCKTLNLGLLENTTSTGKETTRSH